MLDGKYRIEHLLATGGMGAVYAGTHVGLRKRVAIKILNAQHNSAAMVERFHREAVTASQIGHEGIAQVTDLGTSADGEPFLVMEYLEGESLASRLRTTGPLGVEDACELGCAILSPLAAAHRAGIVHRDLKPDNVFLVRQSRGEMVKLLDFGISRAAGQHSNFRLTTTGLVLGTPYYMSPEQARGESVVTPAADLYAFGVILYEMLVGDVPIRADNYNALMYRVTIGDYDPPRVRRPELPEMLEYLIMHAMARTADERPESAGGLEQALLAFCRPVYREHASGRFSTPGSQLRIAVPPDLRGGPADTIDDAQLAAATEAGALDHLTTEAMASAEPIDSEPASSSMLDAVIGGAPVSDPTAIGQPSMMRTIARRRRSRFALVVGGLSIVAAGAVLTLALAPWRTERPPAPRATAPTATATPTPPAPRAAAPIGESVAALPTEPTATPTEPAALPPTPTPAPPATAPPATAPPATAPPAAAPLATAPPAAAQADHAAAAAPTQITLQVAVEPRGAAVSLDGVRIAGAALVVARDDSLHRLEVSAPGYVAYAATIRFDDSKQLAIQLHRTAPVHIRPHRPSARPDAADEPAEHPERPERIDPESPYAPRSQHP